MCLDLKSRDEEPLKATEDIVVYKLLIERLKYFLNCKNISNLHGVAFKAKHYMGSYFEGVLSVAGMTIYLCNNTFRGSNCPEKFGFEYSWVLDQQITSLVVNDVELLKSTSSLLTPYMDFKVTIGNTVKSDIVKEYDTVGEGLHSFEFLEDAKKLYLLDFKELNGREDSIMVFVECIIPKDSMYYKGYFDDYPSYASDQLTYVKIVE